MESIPFSFLNVEFAPPSVSSSEHWFPSSHHARSGELTLTLTCRLRLPNKFHIFCSCREDAPESQDSNLSLTLQGGLLSHQELIVTTNLPTAFCFCKVSNASTVSLNSNVFAMTGLMLLTSANLTNSSELSLLNAVHPFTVPTHQHIPFSLILII